MTNDKENKKRGAVVVPIYNSPRWIEDCVESLFKNSGDEIDIFLQNDCSSDISVLTVLNEFACVNRVYIGHNRTNLGFLGTCNKVFEQIRSHYDYVFLCNTDVLISPRAIEKGMEHFDRLNHAGLMSYLATYGANLTVMLPPGVDYLDLDEYLSKKPLQDSARAITCVGHLLGIRVAAVPEGSLFDPLYGKGYGEESDLHYRLAERGFFSAVCPNSFVYHRGEASFGSSHQKENLELFWSRWGDVHTEEDRFERKHYSLGPVRTESDWMLNPKIAKSIRNRYAQHAPTKVAVILIDVVDHEFFDDLCHIVIDYCRKFEAVVVLTNVRYYECRNLPCKMFGLKDLDMFMSFLRLRATHVVLSFSKPNLKSEMKDIVEQIESLFPTETRTECLMEHRFQTPEYLDAYRYFHRLVKA